jgi:hypothetical protein
MFEWRLVQEIFSLFLNVQPGPVTHCFAFDGYRCFIRGVWPPEREVNHSPPSNAEVKNECRYNSALPVCLRGLTGQLYLFSVRRLEGPLSALVSSTRFGATWCYYRDALLSWMQLPTCRSISTAVKNLCRECCAVLRTLICASVWCATSNCLAAELDGSDTVNMNACQ